MELVNPSRIADLFFRRDAHVIQEINLVSDASKTALHRPRQEYERTFSKLSNNYGSEYMYVCCTFKMDK